MQSQLRNALRRYRNGGNLSIGFLGGSLTAGEGKNDGFSYLEVVALVLEAELGPRVEVRVCVDKHQVRFVHLGVCGMKVHSYSVL